MNFHERYNLKEIPVAGYLCKQKSPTCWISDVDSQNDCVFVIYNDEKKTFSVCIERGELGRPEELIEFRAKTLTRALALANFFLKEGRV